jgi:hypothetical protein
MRKGHGALGRAVQAHQCNPGGAQLRAGAVANGQATKLSPGNYLILAHMCQCNAPVGTIKYVIHT